MKHTPSGKSALMNKEHFPKDKNGNKIKDIMMLIADLIGTNQPLLLP